MRSYPECYPARAKCISCGGELAYADPEVQCYNCLKAVREHAFCATCELSRREYTGEIYCCGRPVITEVVDSECGRYRPIGGKK
jgi:hypothetical protein